MSPVFFKASIGILYGNGQYTDEFLKEHIILENIDIEYHDELQFVMKEMKRCFADPVAYEKNWEDALYGSY